MTRIVISGPSLIENISGPQVMRVFPRRLAGRARTPSILIGQLYSHGELTMPQFEVALSCQEVRNQIAHGFEASDLGEAVERFQSD